MDQPIEAQVIAAEEQLRQAMLISDVSRLDHLLAPEVLITSHLGERLTKQDDLSAHASGLIKINELILSEQRIRLYGEVAIASLRMQISGVYNGVPNSGDFRVTRVWAISPSGSWRVVAFHSSQVAA
jgi:ketosteroid isomerase-like protein